MLQDSNTEQREQKLSRLALYYYPTCPFCVIVLDVIESIGLALELRNIFANTEWRQELIREGGRSTVPCLRIEHDVDEPQWMYESQEIIHYLKTEFL